MEYMYIISYDWSTCRYIPITDDSSNYFGHEEIDYDDDYRDVLNDMDYYIEPLSNQHSTQRNMTESSQNSMKRSIISHMNMFSMKNNEHYKPTSDSNV